MDQDGLFHFLGFFRGFEGEFDAYPFTLVLLVFTQIRILNEGAKSNAQSPWVWFVGLFDQLLSLWVIGCHYLDFGVFIHLQGIFAYE